MYCLGYIVFLQIFKETNERVKKKLNFNFNSPVYYNSVNFGPNGFDIINKININLLYINRFK